MTQLQVQPTEEVVALTDRELEVLQLIVEDRSSKEVADMLYISKRTVDGHRRNINKKLNATNLVQLHPHAVRLKLASPST